MTRATPADDPLRLEDVDRRALWAFCYQMLGSPFDAEDATQDAFERVWRSRDTYDPARSSLKTWAFGIARNVCVDRLRSAARRTLPRDFGAPGIEVGAPLVPRLDVPWLQPAPTGWCGTDETGEAAVRGSELRLAVTALLQELPPPQRAVFVLRDVLGYPASDVAQILEVSVAAVNSSLQRARGRLQDVRGGEPRPGAPGATRERVEAYAAALTVGDAAALERLVTDDVLFEMPPVAQWSVGRATYRAFMANLFAFRGSRWLVRPSSANHQPALVVQHVTDDGPRPHSVQLLDVDASGAVSHVLVYYDPALVELFARADDVRDEFRVAGS